VPERCPLCGFAFRDERVTGADATPYASAYTRGVWGWRVMCEWVWLARTERLKHLALMRASMASRRFARINLALLTLAVGMFEWSREGWKWVKARAELEPSGSTTPSGEGWLAIATAARPLSDAIPGDADVDLWWNVPQAALGVVLGMTAAVLLMALGMSLLRWGVRRAHVAPYSSEERMTAALHYGTAWAVPLSVAGLVMALAPIEYVARMASWRFQPIPALFVVPAAVVCGVSLLLWWYWLLRLAATAPARTRARIFAFLGAGVPLVLAGLVAAWYYGVGGLHSVLSDALRLRF
jgi:hypothetical protein